MVAIAALLGTICAPASAAAPPSWPGEATAIAAPWPGLQEADGHFRDYILARDPSEGRDDYGEAILGYGLLLTAARTGDAQAADAGLRALEYSLDRAARSPSTQVFHLMAVASGYNLARERFPEHPVFQRARGRWEDVLREVEVYRLGKRAVTNKSIVESVLLLELTRSGLRSDRTGTALEDPAATRALVKRFLSKDLPGAAAPFESRGRALLGDMPLLPPAYHALSVGMLGRAIALLGSDAPSAAKALLRRATDASLALTGPDGDAAYFGRSQEQAWTLPLTGYGAEVAGGTAYRGLSHRVVERLIRDYGSGPEGFLVTPSLAQDIDAAIPGIDEYVAGASYVGLTLSALEWAIGAARDGPAGKIGADRGGAYVLGAGSGSWATARSGDVWFAVKRARTSVRDLRYDAGLVALKLRSDGGSWSDVLPLRPRTALGDAGAGPVLTIGGGSGPLEMTALERRKGGGLTGRGGFRTRKGRWLRRAVRFSFAPTSCGVRLTFHGRAGDRYAYTGLFTGEPKLDGRVVADSSQAIELDTPPKLSVGGRYASGADVGLRRGIARFKLTRARTVAIEVCGR